MPVADFNVHLPPDGDFASETDFSRFDALASWRAIEKRLPVLDIDWANVMLLDPLLLQKDGEALLEAIVCSGNAATVGIDPRMPEALELVDQAAALGARGIKFHPYFLDLEDRDFPCALAAAQRAEQHGMWVCVCCSYGTARVYRISGVRLLLFLGLGGIKAPLIALHGGGRHVLDVMLAAEELQNIMLELSFSIPYWLGSSVEQDFVFAIRKLGASRFIYASDHPHQPIEENIGTVRNWLETAGFSSQEQELILHDNVRTRLL